MLQILVDNNINNANTTRSIHSHSFNIPQSFSNKKQKEKSPKEHQKFHHLDSNNIYEKRKKCQNSPDFLREKMHSPSSDVRSGNYPYTKLGNSHTMQYQSPLLHNQEDLSYMQAPYYPPYCNPYLYPQLFFPYQNIGHQQPNPHKKGRNNGRSATPDGYSQQQNPMNMSGMNQMNPMTGMLNPMNPITPLHPMNPVQNFYGYHIRMNMDVSTSIWLSQLAPLAKPSHSFRERALLTN